MVFNFIFLCSSTKTFFFVCRILMRSVSNPGLVSSPTFTNFRSIVCPPFPPFFNFIGRKVLTSHFGVGDFCELSFDMALGHKARMSGPNFALFLFFSPLLLSFGATRCPYHTQSPTDSMFLLLCSCPVNSEGPLSPHFISFGQATFYRDFKKEVAFKTLEFLWGRPPTQPVISRKSFLHFFHPQERRPT